MEILFGALLIRDGNVCLKSIIEKFREISLLKISSEELDENYINLIFVSLLRTTMQDFFSRNSFHSRLLKIYHKIYEIFEHTFQKRH